MYILHKKICQKNIETFQIMEILKQALWYCNQYLDLTFLLFLMCLVNFLKEIVILIIVFIEKLFFAYIPIELKRTFIKVKLLILLKIL